MKTIFMYISETGEIPEDFLYFVRTEFPACGLVPVTYQKKAGEAWQEDEAERLYGRLGSQAADLLRWQFILMVDRRLPLAPEDAYEDSFGLWGLLDHLNRNGKGWTCPAAAPSAVFVLSTLEHETAVPEGSVIKKCRFRDAWSPLCPIRLLVYNFERGDGEPYIRKEALLWLAAAWLLAGGVHVDASHHDSIYQVCATWDDSAASLCLARLRARYEEEQGNLEERREELDVGLPANLIADGKPPQMKAAGQTEPGKEKGKRQRLTRKRRTEEAAQQMRNVAHQMERSAKEEFYKIRTASYYRDEFVEWDIKKIQDDMSIYEEALESLYRAGIWDLEETDRRLKSLQGDGDERGRRAISQALLLALQMPVAAGVLFLFFYGSWLDGLPEGSPLKMSPLIRWMPAVVLAALFLLTGIYCLYRKAWPDYREKRMLNDIMRSLKDAESRISMELSHMANYRQAWHKQHDLSRHLEGVREQSDKIILRERQILKLTALLGGADGLLEQDALDVETHAGSPDGAKPQGLAGKPGPAAGGILEMLPFERVIRIRQVMCREAGTPEGHDVIK